MFVTLRDSDQLGLKHVLSGSAVIVSTFFWKRSSTQSMMRMMRWGGLASFLTVDMWAALMVCNRYIEQTYNTIQITDSWISYVDAWKPLSQRPWCSWNMLLQMQYLLNMYCTLCWPMGETWHYCTGFLIYWVPYWCLTHSLCNLLTQKSWTIQIYVAMQGWKLAPAHGR